MEEIERALTDEEAETVTGGEYDWNKMIDLHKTHGSKCPFCGGYDRDRLGYGPTGYSIYICGDCDKEYLLPDY